MIHLKIVPERSEFTIEGRSTIHPLHAATRALDGYVEAELLPGNRVDLTAPIKGHLEIQVESLKTGNELYDLETRRRIDIRRYPKITADIVKVQELDPLKRYHVLGDLTFYGKTLRVEGDIVITRMDNHSVEATGEYAFDIRDFGLPMPQIFMLKVYPKFRSKLKVFAELAA